MMLNHLIYGSKISSSKNYQKSSNNIEKVIQELLDNNFSSIQENQISNSNQRSGKEHEICKFWYLLKSNQTKDFESLIMPRLSESYGKDYDSIFQKLHFDCLIKKCEYEQAVEKISSKQIPKHPEVCLKHIFCLYQQNHPELNLTIREYKKSHPSHKSFFKLYSSLSKQNYEKCLKIIDSESLSSLATLKAFCLLKLKKISECLEVIEECLEKNNYSEFTWHLAGIVYHELGNFCDSFFSFSMCLRFQPKKPEYLFNLGRLYEKKNSQVFERICLKIWDIDPNFQQIPEFFYPLIDLVEIDLDKLSYVHPSVTVNCENLPHSSAVGASSRKKVKKHKKVKVSRKKNTRVCKNNDEYCAMALASLKSARSKK